MNRFLIACLMTTSLLTIGCACRPTDEIDAQIYDQNNDPLEPMNRAIFKFNTYAGEYVLDPVTDAYQFITPQPLQTGIKNFWTNIKQPFYFINATLQGDFSSAWMITKRFSANTFLGFFGVFDTASDMELPIIRRDFGETLAVWGVEDSGPYLVLPLLGPSNVRDATGTAVDAVIDPINWAIWNEPVLTYTKGGVNGLLTWQDSRGLWNDTKATSMDFYASIRSMYQQNRAKSIDRVLGRDTADPMDDFDFNFDE